MCDKGVVVEVNPKLLPGIKYSLEVKMISLDSCIADLVLYLNKNGLKTTACCCGHHIDDGWIQVRRVGDRNPTHKAFYLMRKYSRENYVREWYIMIYQNGAMNIKFKLPVLKGE